MTSETADRGELEPKRRTGPVTFWREVRAEAKKITWATRQEVTVSTILVLIMVLIAAVFFFVTDWTIGHVVKLILDLVR
ncbi:MAG: preprotein translocase subunit SecE [Hyphomonadaceae bacterium]|nr:preprotein translocase subunit SecE [Hyphomonadaceae bacterium]